MLGKTTFQRLFGIVFLMLAGAASANTVVWWDNGARTAGEKSLLIDDGVTVSEDFIASPYATLNTQLYVELAIDPVLTGSLNSLNVSVGTTQFAGDVLASTDLWGNVLSSTLIGSDFYGFDVFGFTIQMPALGLVAGDTYWLTLGADASGTDAVWWMESDGSADAIDGAYSSALVLGDRTVIDSVFKFAAVPEPGALALFVLGGLMVAAAGRRRRS